MADPVRAKELVQTLVRDAADRAHAPGQRDQAPSAPGGKR